MDLTLNNVSILLGRSRDLIGLGVSTNLVRYAISQLIRLLTLRAYRQPRVDGLRVRRARRQRNRCRYCYPSYLLFRKDGNAAV